MSEYRIKLTDPAGRKYKVSKTNMIITSNKQEKIFKTEEAAMAHARQLIDSGRAKGMSAEIIKD